MLDDYDARDPENGASYAEARNDFPAYVRRLQDDERGVGLAGDRVPESHRWLVEDGEIVAIVRVRHHIHHPHLAQIGGHIGYDVPPSQRGRGHAVAALRAGLARAAELGIPRVLVCADAANLASWRAIERCGGVLEREFFAPTENLLVRRYWIALGEAESRLE